MNVSLTRRVREVIQREFLVAIGFRRQRWFAMALLLAAWPDGARAQAGRGDGFLFREPFATLGVSGGLALPSAHGDLLTETVRNLTVDRADFGAGTVAIDLAFAITRRTDLVFGVSPSSSRTASEFRDWIDTNNQPIEQVTSFTRSPFTVTVRHHLVDKGRRVGSLAWIPARVVPFVGGGVGLMKYRFEQQGDFIDTTSLNIFSDQLRASGWAWVGQVSGGAQLNLSPRLMLTGEMRYLRGSADADRPSRDFVGYRLDLSGITTLLGFTIRL